MGTHNSNTRITPKKGIVQITKHSTPNIKLPDTFKVKINNAFVKMCEYIREGEVSKTVENPVAQVLHNSTTTGRVHLKVKGRAKIVEVDIFGYWPSWNMSDNGKVRLYNKSHGASLMSKMANGTFSNPTQEVLEQMSYLALSVIKARQTTPREGLIKATLLDYLESTGIEVVKLWYRGKEYDRDYLTSKIKVMRTIFDAMQSAGQFKPIERKRDNTVFTIQGR